ncbi:MAG: polyketide synthase, partial [Acidobacteria bacterium]|nr:polyketide synthase [Acidobacteriota bacterium]
MKNDEMDNQPNGLEIAIIGMSGRFPGARNLNEFWENLKNGVISVIKLKDEDIEEAKSKFEIMKQPNWVQARASMDDMEYFDPSFFGYTPKEAELMNPQMRIFHECAWEALEDSGYEPRNYKKPIGLYAGATTSVQWEVGVEISGISRDTGSLGTQQLADKDYLSTRIAYNLNLRGPVMIVQTACSTSLVAIHMACQALLNGECYIALAGGISAFLGLKNGYVFTEGSILSKDGSVRAFDAKASGTVFGNGTGVVALKVLEDAINDRDHIYAVIKATAINN